MINFKTKKYSLLIRILYKIFANLPFLNVKHRFKLFTQLEWLFWRLSIENLNPLYNTKTPPNKISAIEFISEQVNKNSLVLDVGCGDGVLANLISNKVKSVTAIDNDEYHIRQNESKFINTKNLNFIKDDVFNFININKKKYDLILCSHIIEHMEYPQDFLKNIKFFCKFIYIEIPDFDSSYLNLAKLEFDIDPKWTDDDHKFEFNRDTIKKLFKSSGLIILKEEYRYGNMRFICRSE